MWPVYSILYMYTFYTSASVLNRGLYDVSHNATGTTALLVDIFRKDISKHTQTSVRILADVHSDTCMLMLQVCRGLFEAHRLIFSFLICTAIQRHTSGINTVELALLLGGLQPIPTSRPNPAPTVINPQQWGSLAALEEAVPSFSGLLRSVTLDTQQWLKWVQASSLGMNGMPSFGQVSHCCWMSQCFTLHWACSVLLMSAVSACHTSLHYLHSVFKIQLFSPPHTQVTQRCQTNTGVLAADAQASCTALPCFTQSCQSCHPRKAQEPPSSSCSLVRLVRLTCSLTYTQLRHLLCSYMIYKMHFPTPVARAIAC